MPRAFDTYWAKATLPAELEPLKELAYNLHWAWEFETISLFRRLDRDLWDSTNHNPVRMLGLIKQDKLDAALKDDGFIAHLRRAHDHHREYMSARTWFESEYGKISSPKIAYFSMEFGLTECLPIYSGGLGILAGDHLKSASDLGLPLVGVGLLYQKGYFQQYLNADGWQQETYPDNDFYNLPIEPMLEPNGSPILVSVSMLGRTVHCRIWRAQVGRIPLYLLDTNIPENDPVDRKISFQLYGGDHEMRIQQEIVLGICGMRALRKLDLHVHVCHMNEGHAAFIAFERIRHRRAKDKLTTLQALEVVRGGTIFTTHTPVPAGIDTFHPSLVERYLADFFSQSDIDKNYLMSLGKANPSDPNDPFNMAILALRTTAKSNGVSMLHAEVSRKMWQSNWPKVPLSEVPITHVTNGVHPPSYISMEMQELLLRYIGPKWVKQPGDQSIWQAIERIPDLELWRTRERRREHLVAFARHRFAQQLKRRGANRRTIEEAYETLNPDVLTIGFARRFATYKRANLLLRDPERLMRIISNKNCPVQFIFAGKAHPRDNEGKQLIKQIIHFARDEEVRKSFVFLENYDINVARYLVQGVDLWLNNPRRPMEASGTSGMKVIFNGGLNLSVLDGWWAEGYDHSVGWAIGAGEDYEDPDYQDEVESKAIYDVLENEIIPLYYGRTKDGIPRGWISKIKQSMTVLSPQFTTHRMVTDYARDFYMPSYARWKDLANNEYSKAKELSQWKQDIVRQWPGVKVINAEISARETDVGSGQRVIAEVYLGSIKPQDVSVEIFNGRLDSEFNITQSTTETMEVLEPIGDGKFRYQGQIDVADSGLFGYSVRVMPKHPEMPDNFGLSLIRWIGDM